MLIVKIIALFAVWAFVVAAQLETTGASPTLKSLKFATDAAQIPPLSGIHSLNGAIPHTSDSVGVHNVHNNQKMPFNSLDGASMGSSMKKSGKPSAGGNKIGMGAANNATLTVSGISSGSFAATQMHTAFSSIVDGIGAVAGGMYYSAQGNVALALELMTNPSIIPYSTILGVDIPSLEITGAIDNTINLAHTRAFLFSGTLDTIVNPGNMQLLQSFYQKMGVSTLSEFTVPAEHSMPTVNYGNACGYLGTPYINSCGYDTVYNMLSYLIGTGLQKPVKYLEENLLIIDQRNYVPPIYEMVAAAAGINNRGYIYVPSGCKHLKDGLSEYLFESDDSTKYETLRKKQWENAFMRTNENTDRDINGNSKLTMNGNCRVHMAFHGCEQTLQQIGEEYVRKTGYLEYAESNDIVVVFPQAAPVLLTNPKGCFDWWGYSGVNYHTKTSIQMMTFMNIATSAIKYT